MCGIAGTSQLTIQTHKALDYMAYAMEQRGDDSWGITNGSYTHREVGPISTNWHVPQEFKQGDVVSLHTRAASVGAVNVVNQHPFHVEGPTKVVLGMHNGCVNNYKILADKYKDTQGVWDVDSAYIFAQLAHNRPTSEIYGWGALVWWEWTKYMKGGKPQLGPPIVKFLRFNMDSFYVARLEGSLGLLWCSDKTALERAARMAKLRVDFFYDLKGDQEYLYSDGLMKKATPKNHYPLATGETRPFGGRGWTGNTHSNHNNHYYNNNYNTSTKKYENTKQTSSPQQVIHVPKQSTVSYCSTARQALHTKSMWSIGDIGKAKLSRNECVMCAHKVSTRETSVLCDDCLLEAQYFAFEVDNENTSNGGYHPIVDKEIYFVYDLDYIIDTNGEILWCDEESPAQEGDTGETTERDDRPSQSDAIGTEGESESASQTPDNN